MYKYTGVLEIIISSYDMSKAAVPFTFYDRQSLTRDSVKERAIDTIADGRIFYGVSAMTYDVDVVYMCKHNDCGWCYYHKNTENNLQPNDDNGQCNHPQECEVNKSGE